jgi:probable HAF family extracellular repeat protein
MSRVLLACVCTLIATSAAAAPVFNVRQVANPTGRQVASVGGINDFGEVVGATAPSTGTGATRAFFWNPVTSKFTTLASLTATAKGEDAAAISNTRQIVGSSTNSLGKTKAVSWKNGAVKALAALPNQTGSYAASVNNVGQIVGRSVGGSCGPVACAVIWQAGTGIKELGAPKGVFYRSWANDINDTGYVIGTYYEDDYGFPFLWHATTGLVLLPIIESPYEFGGQGVRSTRTDAPSASAIYTPSRGKQARTSRSISPRRSTQMRRTVRSRLQSTIGVRSSVDITRTSTSGS